MNWGSLMSHRQMGRQIAFEFVCHGAGHDDMAVALAPRDQKVAARQAHPDLAHRKLAPRGGDGGGAGGRAAGPREASATLPGAKLQMRRVEDLDEFIEALEATGAGESMFVSNLGAVGVDAQAQTHDYRCAFNPLG